MDNMKETKINFIIDIYFFLTKIFPYSLPLSTFKNNIYIHIKFVYSVP